MNKGNGGIFISQLGSQTYILAIASHGLGYGGWSCHECQSGSYIACIFQYHDKIEATFG